MKKMNNGANVNKSTSPAKQGVSQHNAVETINFVLNGSMTTVVVDHHDDPIFRTPGDDVQVALDSLVFTCVDTNGSTWDVAFEDLAKFTEEQAAVIRLRLSNKELEILRKKAIRSNDEKDWTLYLDEFHYEVSQITETNWFPKVKRSIINSQLAGGNVASLRKEILARINEIQYSRLDKDEKAWRVRKLRSLLGDRSLSKMEQSLKKAQAKYYGYRD